MLYGETLHTGAPMECVDEDLHPGEPKALVYEVCMSAAGYYWGTYCPVCGPYSRESEYYATREEALADPDYAPRGETPTDEEEDMSHPLDRYFTNPWGTHPGATHQTETLSEAHFQFARWLTGGWQSYAYSEIASMIDEDMEDFLLERYGSDPIVRILAENGIEAGIERLAKAVEFKKDDYGPACGCDMHWSTPVDIPNDGRCTRCNGERYMTHFAHVANGVCFRCNGTGMEPSS